jgi:hypothetical protein
VSAEAAPAKRCAGVLARSRVRCKEAATNVVRAGCVHEHITDTYACDRHVTELESGAINCAPCYRHDGHVCRLMGRAEPVETLAAKG